MTLIRPDLWTPIGIESLEPTADVVVRSNGNTLVVAGPGAGKTELLAQRACYLLQTGTCPLPRRILAISFKRDAAHNLGDRVSRRSGKKAKRFDSFTLDAFAKNLVDRFLPGIPEAWRPKLGYEVRTANLRSDDMREWLRNAGVPEGHAPIDLEGYQNDDIKRFFDKMASGFELPYLDENIPPLARHWGVLWWREQLNIGPGRPSLTFPMLNRLAAYLLRQNPKLISAIRATYSYVFLDEFQDTTGAQYDLVRSAFRGSDSIMTAVGDGKQRIMVWAGALVDAFDFFQTDFVAEKHSLLRNYRSAPELVQMQNVIAQTLETGAPDAEAVRVNAEGICALLEFRNPEQEAEYIANMIESGIQAGERQRRDFCVLVRQRTADIILHLKTALASRGIKLRDESELQDLLVEPVVKFILAILRLATRQRDPDAWNNLTSELAYLFGLNEDDNAAEINQKAIDLLQHARNRLQTGHALNSLSPDLVNTVGQDVFRSAYRQYGNGSFLQDTLTKLTRALEASEQNSNSYQETVDDLMGIDVVPAMTIHKSKGLEFHTVIFLGLEDSQWWSFRNQPDEEKRGFFVAFSRAIDRVFFTFSDERDERGSRRRQRRGEIGDLYTVLQQAGVPRQNLRGAAIAQT